MSRVDDLLGRFGGTAAESLSARPRDIGVSASAVRLQRVTLDRIVGDPQNIRGVVDESAVDEMAASLRESGMLQPIRLRWSAPLGAWVIVSGHTRAAAARRLAWEAVDAVCYPEGTPDAVVRRDQLAENLVRRNVDPLKTATALREMMDDIGCTAEDLSSRVGIHKSTVSRLLGLLRLPEAEQRRVASGEVSLREAVVRAPRKGRARGRRPRSVETVVRLSRTQRVTVVGGPDDDVLEILRQAVEAVERERTGKSAA